MSLVYVSYVLACAFSRNSQKYSLYIIECL